MKHLFVTRHGSYFDHSRDYGRDYYGRINDQGRLQIERLGKAIKQILNEGSIYLFSSTAPRALDSSQILAVQLALSPNFEQVPYLEEADGELSPGWIPGYSRDSFGQWEHLRTLDRLMNLVNERRDKADGLIMITHAEVAEKFPDYFLKKEFGQNTKIGEIFKGRAVHLDLENRTYQILPR